MPITALSRLTRCAATLAAAAGCLAATYTALPAAPAAAQPMSTKTFTYADMPDIDQKRAIGKDGAGLFHPGLPNGGIMYCGPTAGMNVLAFLADHGAADVSPNSKDWTLAANYDAMSGKLSSSAA